MEKGKLINVIIILLIIFWLWWSFDREKDDFKVRNINIDDNDSLDKSVKKIQILSESQLDFPKWRRCFIISVLLSISLSVLLFNTLKMREMMIILLCSFTLMYACYNYYDFHYYKYIDRKIYIISENIRVKNIEKSYI
jgi:hypothetical protein